MRMLAFAVAITIPTLLRGELGPESPTLPLPVAEIVSKMEEQDQAISDSLIGYTCERRYSLENRRFKKKAALRVRMTYS